MAKRSTPHRRPLRPISIDTAIAEIDHVLIPGAAEIHLYDLAALALTQPEMVRSVLWLTNRRAKEATGLRRATD